MSVTISVPSFWRRLTRFEKIWKGEESIPDAEALPSANSFVLVAGNSDQDNPYRKGAALQTWLLGYEFPSTALVITKTGLVFFGSSTKAKYLDEVCAAASDSKLNPLKLEVTVLTKSSGKDPSAKEKDNECWQKILDSLEAPVGIIGRDKYEGKFFDEWNDFLKSQSKELEEVDLTSALAAVMGPKDEDEMKNSTNAAKMSVKMMSIFSDLLLDVAELDKKPLHEKLAEKIEGKLEDDKVWKGFKGVGADFTPGFGDWCYSPIIQSGGNYDLRSSASSDDTRLSGTGVILCSLGIRYRSYCSNIGRTFMIDPNKSQEDNYEYLVKLHKFAVKQIKDGVTCKEVHQSVVEKLKEERSDLEGHFLKTIGFGTGVEFRESNYILSAKCTKKIVTGMVFSVGLGFQNLPDPSNKSKTYALSLIDTVQAGPNEGVSMTDGITSRNEVVFQFDADEPQNKKSKPNGAAKASKPGASVRGSGINVKSKLRNENREVDTDAQQRRKQHQKELAEKRQEEGLERFASGEGTGAGQKMKQWKRFESYARESQLPAVKDHRIFVDTKRSSIILPINGFAVPIHINALKSVTRQEEGEYTSLRFMFIAPGQITGKKEDTPFEDPNASFIRLITFRSMDNFRFTELHREITELKKNATKRENERKELADVVEQDTLEEVKGKKPVRLQDIQVRPSFDGKRQQGDVEIHRNGIRYQSTLRHDHRIDLLFNNVKHFFFQPCDYELIGILHVHLKNPILVGKKKTKDVQFFREASEAAFDETGNRKRRRQYHDEDEIEAEQEERKRRASLNKYFKAFADKVAEASGNRVEVDVPFREIGFTGVPFRQDCLLQPTTDCLVHLTDPPFTVITLDEVEIAHLERVQYGLKNFDLVFVMRDFGKPVVHINAVPQDQLEIVKDWLDSVDIPFSEGPVNLNWPAIMKHVNEDPQDFFSEGGWAFLGNKSDDSDSDASDSASEFEVSDAELDESSEESSFSEGGGSGSARSDEESEFDDDASEDDWEELEKKAAKKDAKGGGADSDDDDRPKKKKAAGGGGGGARGGAGKGAAASKPAPKKAAPKGKKR